MLIDPVLAASTHRLSRSQSWSALVTVTSPISLEVNCQMIASSPRAAPMGRTRNAQTGIRYRTRPVMMERLSRVVSSKPVTHSACSTEKITTQRFIVRKRKASQPSDGRNNLARAIDASTKISVLSRSRAALGSANPLTVMLCFPEQKAGTLVPDNSPGGPPGDAELHSKPGLFLLRKRRCHWRTGCLLETRGWWCRQSPVGL